MATRLSAPIAKDPAGMAMVTLPLTSVAAAEANLPLLSLTVPAGTGSPVGAATATFTVSGCTAVMLAEDSVRVAVGVKTVTLTDTVADTLL